MGRKIEKGDEGELELKRKKNEREENVLNIEIKKNI